MRRAIQWTLLPVLVCTGGCQRPLTLDEYFEATADSFCAKMFECCTTDELGRLIANPLLDMSSEKACQDSYGLITDVSAAPFREGLDAGRVTFDEEAAQTCLDAFDGLDCDSFRAGQVNEVNRNCDTPVKPNVEIGGECASDFECLRGICRGASLSAADGTCTELPDRGELCQTRCKAGLICRYRVETNLSHCEEIPTDGERCSGACAQGSVCLYDNTVGATVCRAPPEIGEPCSGVCASGAYCNSSTDLCEPQRDIGATCSAANECRGGGCNDGVCVVISNACSIGPGGDLLNP